MNRANVFPPPGIQALSALPDPYQTAFRMGSAHHLPGRWLPAQTDWFLQIFLLPFLLMYASPLLTLVPWLAIAAIQRPASYRQLWQQVSQQTWPQIGITLLLLIIAAVLVGYCANEAWQLAQSLYRTWHCRRLQQRGEHSYGLVLLSHGLVGRLIDNIGRHNCLWLPKAAIAEIAWQQMREAGAKRSRWVQRTRICYVSANGDHHWLTLRGDIVKLGYGAGDAKGNRALYDTLSAWWHEQETSL